MADEQRDLATLEAERLRSLAALGTVGDFRRGSLNEAYRRCGKARCRCADPAHPGHGPLHLLTRSVGGRTVTRAVREGPELEKVRTEVAAYRRFRALVDGLVEVNEAICEARPVIPSDDALATTGAADDGRGGSGRGSGTRSPPRQGA